LLKVTEDCKTIILALPWVEVVRFREKLDEVMAGLASLGGHDQADTIQTLGRPWGTRLGPNSLPTGETGESPSMWDRRVP
jgi:hypothetical protein